MQLFAIGLNHQTAPLNVREQVVFHAERLVGALNDLVARRPVQEAAIISTCNRTEIYCHAEEPRAAVEWMASYHQLKPAQIEPDRKSTRLNSSHIPLSRMPSSA